MKVICINGKEFSKAGEEVPLEGKIYTIRDMFFVPMSGDLGYYFFRLEEIVNSPRPYSDIGFAECAFSQYAFKPVEYVSAISDILHKFKVVEERSDIKIEEPALV